MNPTTCSCENDKSLASIIYNSVITCREIVDAEAEANSYDKEKKLLQQILIKKSICRKENIYVLLAFLLITIQLLISDSSYCYIIKYQAKKKAFVTISCDK